MFPLPVNTVSAKRLLGACADIQQQLSCLKAFGEIIPNNNSLIFLGAS